MAKVKTTITLEGETLRFARERFLNVSGIAEEALRAKLQPGIKEVSRSSIKFKCSECGAIVDYGFLCEERDLFLCQNCQDNFNMANCPHDKRGEHFHFRIPGFEGQFKEKIKIINPKHLSGSNSN